MIRAQASLTRTRLPALQAIDADNTIVTDSQQAQVVAEAVHAVDPSLPVLGLAGSAFLRAAEKLGLRFLREAFADRTYRSDGQLLSRRPFV